MDELQDLKKTLKKWENLFYCVHQQKPTKNDIAVAPGDIKDAYEKYRKLKLQKGNLGQELSKVSSEKLETQQISHEDSGNLHDQAMKPGEQMTCLDDTWGRQFDKPKSGKKMSEVISHTEQKPDFFKKLSDKLFANSTKFMGKESPQITKKPALQKSNIFKPEGGHCESVQSPKDSIDSFHKELPVQEKCTGAKNNDMTLPSCQANETALFKRDIFQKALTLSCRKIIRSTSDDIIVPQLLKTKLHLSLPSQRRSLTNLKLKKYNPNDDSDTEDGSTTTLLTERIDMSSASSEMEEVTSDEKKKPKNKIPDNFKQWGAFDADVDFDDIGEVKTREKHWKDKFVSVTTVNRTGCEKPGDNSHGMNALETELQQPLSHQQDHQPTNTYEYDISDDEVVSKAVAKRKRKAPTVAKNKKRKMEKVDGVAVVSGSDASALPMECSEDDVNNIPRKKQVSRKSVSVSGGNFVKLNMKVKKYSHRGNRMNGEKYKRMQWKQKMKARSKSYGDKCFKCGQSGHWANKCPGGTQTGSSVPVKEEDFPDLQEIILMAKGVKRPDTSARKKVIIDESSTEAMDVELEVECEIIRDRKEVAEPPSPVDPILQLTEAGEMPTTPSFVLDALKKFGFDSFRPGQQIAVKRILCGLSTLVVLSTGGGKSLCYQLPAYLYGMRQNCITLVISPLVSLMEDQVTGLPPGVNGLCLHTNMTSVQRESVLTAVKEGKVHFLLISPEAIAGGSMSLLYSFSSSTFPRIGFVCIDEAHCLSEWSHNFRPSYLRLCKVLKERFGIRCFLGLTATATLSTASCVARQLGIEDFESATIRGSPVPTNLLLSVSCDDNRDEALLGILQGDRLADCESIIIYCTRREQTERLATLIRTCMKDKQKEDKNSQKKEKKGRLKRYGFWDAESYHAGLTAAQRKRVQNAFMSGRLRIVVATVAFGMGLDKANVRGVIHYNMPKSFESYVQEIGRAGRDGKPSHCHLFLDSQGDDVCELRRHVYANTVDYRILKKLVQRVFLQCRCKDVHQRHQQALKDIQQRPVESQPGFDDAKCEFHLDNDEFSGDDESLLAAENVASDLDKVGESRICPGHERALPIEQTVMDLDIKEEGISTLLCYLELHDKLWLESMQHVYANCKIQCYGGPSQLQTVAKKCPPVGVAVARAKRNGKTFANTNQIDFNVVEISDTMGWDSGPVKRELKCLSWNLEKLGGPSKSGVMVEFSDLAFHFRSPGDLDIEELDDVLQFLHERVQKQEKTELTQLQFLCKSLKSISHKNYWMCADSLDMKRNDKLKAVIHEYFDKPKSENQDDKTDQEVINPGNVSQLLSDIHQFYGVYGEEHTLTGRVIARIFHGIASPCFPASTWGRVRRFWRSHLNIDFNFVMKTTTQQLLKMR